MHSVLHTVLHDVLCECDTGGSQSPRRWKDEPPRTSPRPMTGRTSELGMIRSRATPPASTAWAVPRHADGPLWLTSPAASPRELPPRYGTLPRASDQTHCGEIELLFHPLLGRPTGRLRPGYQQARRPRAAPRPEDAPGPGEQHGDCVRLGAESQWRTGDGNTMSGRCVCHDRFRGSQNRSARSTVEAWPKASICSVEVSSSAARSACGLPPDSCQAIKRHPSRVGAPYINRASLG